MCALQRPKPIVRQVVLHFYSLNHHYHDNVITNYVKHHKGFHSITEELD